jgi:hypothetical protein
VTSAAICQQVPRHPNRVPRPIGYKAREEIVVLEEMPRTVTASVDLTGLKRMAEPAVHAPVTA